jgi:hypothetical protein
VLVSGADALENSVRGNGFILARLWGVSNPKLDVQGLDTGVVAAHSRPLGTIGEEVTGLSPPSMDKDSSRDRCSGWLGLGNRQG